MKRSVNEISGMIAKAARGAGIPLGHADDLGRAAGWMACHNPDGLGQFCGVLDAGRGSVVAMQGLCAIDDLMCENVAVVVHDIDAPAVLCALAGCAGGIVVSFDGTTATLTPCKSPAPDARSGAVIVDGETWAHWAAFAAKTYVPATEASRIAGAGAGLTDND